MDERRCDVVVIGAGLSGLTAARRSASLGAEVMVLEARDRVGGRTLSVEAHGAVFEHGAQWIGPTQSRVHALARELGVATFPQHHAGTKVLDMHGRLSSYSGDIPKMSLVGLLLAEVGLRRIDRMASRVPLAAPEDARDAARWDADTLATFRRQLLPHSEARALFDVAEIGRASCRERVC